MIYSKKNGASAPFWIYKSDTYPIDYQYPISFTKTAIYCVLKVNALNLGKDATCLKKDFRKIIKNTLKKGYAVMAQ